MPCKTKKKAKGGDDKNPAKPTPEEEIAEEEAAPEEKSIDAMTDAEFSDYLKAAADEEPYAAETAAEGPETEEASAEAAEAEAVGDQPFKTFATEDEYNSAMEDYANRIYGERLRNGDAAMAQLSQLSDQASRYYDDGEQDPLGRLRGDLESQTAQRYGQTPEQYRQSEADRRDLEAYRSQQQAQQSQQAGRQAIIDRWNAESDRLRQSVPDFDLETALKNDEFKEMVVRGASIDGAYYAVKYNELQSQQAQQARKPIMQNAAQSGTKPGSSVNELMQQSDGDFRRSLKSIMNS